MKIESYKGITLISLVVTIIVSIILAGVSINLLLGENGIITRAKYAKESYLNAQVLETDNLDKLYEQLNGLPKNTKDTKSGTLVEIPSNWYTDAPNYIETKTGQIVKRSTKVASVYAVATGNGEQVPVPLGFYYVGGTIASGVVISDNSKDQNKFAEKDNVPTGVEYNSDGTVKTYTDDAYDKLTDEEKGKVLLGNQFVWIPCELANYKKVDWSIVGGKDYDDATWETQTHSSELTQIEKYGGFYVGRYEAGTSNITLTPNVNFGEQTTISDWINDAFSIRDGLNHTYTGSITCKAGEIPYYHADYFTALKLSNNMYKMDYVRSGLITGTMWDVMMNFIAEGTNATVTTESTWGNYGRETTGVTYTTGQGRYASVNPTTGAITSGFQVSDTSYHFGIRTTASTEGVKKKNLYDIAGNLWEWTQEAAYKDTTESYLPRGGSFRHAYDATPACDRGTSFATTTHTTYGFRPALFIK